MTEVGDPLLLETKLVPARVRGELLARERLLGELERLASTTLTLVDAPVGFGKTVLVQTWCARTSSAVAWVSLDRGDDDPARFWTYVATAVDRIRPGLGRLALTRLRAPGVPVDAGVDELMNGLAAYQQPLTIVLDDLHLLGDPSCHESIDRAFDRLPQNARIVATTRVDPPLRLARLRARGLLGEIRARELAFTIDEAAELLIRREGIAIDLEDVELLVDRTEGWPAGLYLAALWLRTVDDPHARVGEFHGSNRHVADYLASEVLDALDDGTRDFLTRTSVFERFSASLCDAVLDRDDSAGLIEDLAASNLFLVPLDASGEWFRYHHLFAELLQLELAGVDRSAADTLRRRACEWFGREGFLEDALAHAGAARDDRRVADLLFDNYAPLIRNGREATYLRWVAELPRELLLERPVLAAGAAIAARIASRPAAERRHYRTLAENVRRDAPEAWTPDAEVGLAMASLGWIETELEETRQRALSTAEYARERSDLAVPAFATVALTSYYVGEIDEASRYAHEALERPEVDERPHGAVTALAVASLLASDGGDVEAAESYAGRALASAARAGIQSAPTTGVAHVALAAALEARGSLSKAEREATAGQRLRQDDDPELGHAHALLVLARIRARLGRVSQATADLAKADDVLRHFRDAGRLPDLARNVAAELHRARESGGTLVEAPTEAELNVLRLLASDLSQREIGAQLFLSVNTVKTHTRLLYRKLGVSSRADAVRRASALGLVDDAGSPG